MPRRAPAAQPQQEQRQAWEHRPNESPPAFAAFAAYRDMGPSRSTAKVGQQVGKSKDLMDRWSTRHAWVARAAAYDAHVDAVRRAAQEDEIRRMNERQARQTHAVQLALGAPAEAMLKRLRANPAEVEELPASVLWEMAQKGATGLVAAAKAERLARGADTERVSITRQDDPLVAAILQDPAIAEEAGALLQRIAARARPGGAP